MRINAAELVAIAKIRPALNDDLIEVLITSPAQHMLFALANQFYDTDLTITWVHVCLHVLYKTAGVK